MKNVLTTLKEKIDNYNQKISNVEIEKDSSKAENIKKEIENLKSKIVDIQSSMQTKTKLEQMKMTLELSSLESEISLKEMELEEKQKEAEKDYNNQVSQHNNEIKVLEEDLISYIKTKESEIEKLIKSSQVDESSIILTKDLQDIKGYYSNIMQVERNNKSNLEKELKPINTKIENLENHIKIQNEIIGYCYQRASSWAMKEPTTFWGDYDEDKAEEYQENMEAEHREAERLQKELNKVYDELRELQQQKTKLDIKKEACIKKIETTEMMINEMIKEIIIQLLNDENIVMPAFVPVSKYFNYKEEN